MLLNFGLQLRKMRGRNGLGAHNLKGIAPILACGIVQPLTPSLLDSQICTSISAEIVALVITSVMFPGYAKSLLKWAK
jgi:hypothetical protein